MTHRNFFLVLATLVLLSTSCKEEKNPLAAATPTDFCASIHRDTTTSLSAALKGLENKMQDQTGVYVLENGNGAMVTRAWLSEYAEESIDIQYFIFSTDNIGLIACDYLVRAADRGVKIRMIVDDIMVDADVQDILTLDSHENISIKVYNPGVNLGKSILGRITKFATDFRSANQRMHNKTFIVDSKVVITGGRNIADEYFDYDHEYNFRDRDVLLLGKETKAVNSSFTDFWDNELSIPVTEVADIEADNISDEKRFDRLHEYACNPDNFWPQVREQIAELPKAFEAIKASDRLVWVDDVQFVSDAPGKNDGTAGLSGGGISTDSLISLVKNAKTAVDIQSPYLITTKVAQDLFKAAVDRGVKVRILTNSLASTDNLEAFSGYQKDRKKLLETGVRIFEFRPDAAEQMEIMTGALQETLEERPIFGLHAKSMVVDGNIAVIGTFNLDPRSANLNTECIAIIRSEKVAQQVLSQMEIDYKPENSWETTLDFNPDKEVGGMKRAGTFVRKVLPKNIL